MSAAPRMRDEIYKRGDTTISIAKNTNSLTLKVGWYWSAALPGRGFEAHDGPFRTKVECKRAANVAHPVR